MRTLNYILGAACIIMAIVVTVDYSVRFAERANGPHWLTGTWFNAISLYRIDMEAKTLELSAFTAVTRKSFTVVAETRNSVTIVTDGPPLLIVHNTDGTILMHQDGRLPGTLTRQQ